MADAKLVQPSSFSLLRSMNLIHALFGLVLAVPDGLFGGDCTVIDDSLIITAAFYKEAGVPVMSRNSYYIDLTSQLTLTANSQVGWNELSFMRKMPGQFFLYGDESIMYSMGSNTVEPTNMKGSSTDDNPLSEAVIKKSNKPAMPSHIGNEDDVPTRVDEAMYLEALNKGLNIVVIYKNIYHILQNPELKEDILSVISTATEDSKFNNISLKGTPPPYMPGYSVTLRLNTVYIATSNKIHTLDLDRYEWKEHTVNGFKAAQSGCLKTHKNTLIHAFGKEGNTYLNRTQFIDMNTWELKDSLSFDKSGGRESETSNGSTSAKQKALHILNIILVICVSLLALVVLAGCTTHCIRKHRKLPELTVPEYYTETVWAEPSSAASQSYQLDLSLSIDGEISHDLTPGSSSFSSDYLNSPYQSIK
ncbi:hypothetical protein DSO57_1011838 [Entomophthora muscae]|uniref:Uncharacterized protein n=1 Tax=Entomophthora muscae TaxID=34485 RepID=A0ACC2RL18_9FUNG|nr:hypothetical protein DSO57_1011838 [Entomophthora muscae]